MTPVCTMAGRDRFPMSWGTGPPICISNVRRSGLLGMYRQLTVIGHPTTAQHGLLVKLIADIETKLGEKIKLHNFLTSDLGSPLPLHISLSRPITLSTAEKDDFLEKITDTVQSSHTGAFGVSPSQLIWYKSPDSDRIFLVLQVASKGSCNTEAPNPELASLLTRCNKVVTSFSQPALYQQTQKGPVGSAFHVSIGWTFDLPDAEAAEQTVNLFGQSKFKALSSWKIEVSGVKAKIGNIVSHLALGDLRRDSQSGRSGSLYE